MNNPEGKKSCDSTTGCMSKPMTKGWWFPTYWSKKLPGVEGIKVKFNESRREKHGTHGARVGSEIVAVG